MRQRRVWGRYREYYAFWVRGIATGLARRMLLWILSISAVAALMATSIQLFFDYRRDLSDLEQGMRYIEQNQLPGLADAAWNFNVAGLRVQLDGIGRSPWVAGATVRYGPSQSAELTTGEIRLDERGIHDFVLQRNGVVVGKIYIAPNLQTLYGRTLDRIAIVLATQGVKSLVISICILLVTAWMVTRHLTQMAGFAKSFEPGRQFKPFVLRRNPKTPRDELAVLADALNDAYQRLYTAHEFEARHNEILSEEVAQRTAELSDAHRKLARLAVTDRLTGLVNRLGLEETFARELGAAHAGGRALSVIIADIDMFKAVNDTWGHQAGDAVLQEFAAILIREARGNDVVGRWGGEEFLILCPQTGLEGACLLAERMRASVAAHAFPVIGSKTSTFGVASFRSGDSENSLLKRADDALYRAKAVGRNSVGQEAADSDPA
ncbi:diguanylate cyclase (GGDEF) domain-containing protein [Andreprevotia lacus DSM 23236]|jgi:diguanylate cyclase (GGDEF)-like protein|uniref:diguanylate cyclase n=1 Tax=Andreprevotia lacus DSM 23236 TaxID=1121001 RepID=A0A1W1XPI6_9NEIS|nr:diguanylate cyclase [Andreprevotia lacus]SMC25883.1 diguanylate cyclase (GGDEF) domain-containing protein [Andreprevotia lacus DSM 23236]